MKARKLLVAPVVLGLAAAMFAGCGNSTNSTGNPSAKSAPKVNTTEINKKDRSELKDGGELRLAIGKFATQWNPMHTNGTMNDASMIRLPMMPAFFLFDADNLPSVNKNFADDIKNEMKGDKQVVTYKLNPKAIWNDGTPLGLKDFVATWKICDGATDVPDGACASTDGFDQIDSVVQGANAQEIVVTYKTTYPDWRAVFTPLMKADSIKDAATFNEGWKDAIKNEWLSGPFKVSNIDKSAKVATLVPNDKWWGDKPKLEKIIYKVLDASADAAAFGNKELDAFDIGVNADNLARAKARPDADIRRAAGPQWRHFTMNTTAPSLKDKAVRVAIMHYLDRKLVTNSDMAGMSWEAPVLNNHIFMSNQKEYTDIAKATGIDFDVAKGDKVLTDAGYTKGSDGLWAKDGKPIEIKFTSIAGVKVSENEAKQFQDQMKKAGIKVEIISAAQDKWNDVLDNREFEIVAFTWIGNSFPIPSVKNFFMTKAGQNYTGYSNPEADELIKKISTEADVAKRVDMVNKVEEMVWKDPQIIPLYQRPEQKGCAKDLANWGAFGMSDIVWENIGWLKK